MFGYKVFDRHMRCDGDQYMPGATTEHTFHLSHQVGISFYENAVDSLNYHDLDTDNRYAAVRADSEIIRDVNRSFTSCLTVVQELTRDEFAALCSGTKISYSGGRVASVCMYECGELHGLARHWHDNGVLAAESIYSRGLRHGKSYHWHPNGRAAETCDYNRGLRHGKRFRWHPTGRHAAECRYQHDVRHGSYIRWDVSGHLVDKCTYHLGVRV